MRLHRLYLSPRNGFVLAAMFASNALTQTDPRPSKLIVGGKPVNDIAEAHWQVALVDGNDSRHFAVLRRDP